MVIAVMLYTFVVAVVVNVFRKIDKDELILKNKIKLVNYFSGKHSLPKDVNKKMIKHFESQAKNGFSDEDWANVFKDLPPTIQTEILAATHGEIISKVTFF